MSAKQQSDIDPRVPLLVFSPYDGFPIQWLATREAYREHHPELEWRFNPWTGNPRHAIDIVSDPKGFLIWDSAWGPMRAAAERDPRFDKTIGAAPPRRLLVEIKLTTNVVLTPEMERWKASLERELNATVERRLFNFLVWGAA